MKTAALSAHLTPTFGPTAASRPSDNQYQYAAASARSQEANISLTTSEGDRITINQTAISRQLLTASNEIGTGNGGRTESQSQAVLSSFASQGMAISVQGDLNEQELTDLGNLLGDLSSIASDFFSGNLDQAVSGAMQIGDMGSISKLNATFSQSTLLSQHLTGNHPLPALDQAGQDPLFDALLASRDSATDKTPTVSSLAAQWQQFLAQLGSRETTPKATDSAPPTPTQSAQQAGADMLARSRQTVVDHPRLTPLLPSVADLAIALARKHQPPGTDSDQLAAKLSKSFGEAFSVWLL